jgi:hypothetical protein
VPQESFYETGQTCIAERREQESRLRIAMSERPTVSLRKPLKKVEP